MESPKCTAAIQSNVSEFGVRAKRTRLSSLAHFRQGDLNTVAVRWTNSLTLTLAAEDDIGAAESDLSDHSPSRLRPAAVP